MLRLQGVNVIIALIVAFAILHLAFTPEHHSVRTTWATLLVF